MGEKVSLKEAAARSGYSKSYLARMLKAGRIAGELVKPNLIDVDVWLVDTDSLAAYPASRQKPGIKPGTKRK